MLDFKPRRITGIAYSALSTDGAHFGFRVLTKDGQATDLEIETSKIGLIVQHLVAAAAAMAQQAHENGVKLNPTTASTAPIPTMGIAVGTGPTPEESLLLVHLFGFYLGFKIPVSELTELAENIRRSAMLMTQDVSKPN
jgi:hypothetical protein